MTTTCASTTQFSRLDEVGEERKIGAKAENGADEGKHKSFRSKHGESDITQFAVTIPSA